VIAKSSHRVSISCDFAAAFWPHFPSEVQRDQLHFTYFSTSLGLVLDVKSIQIWPKETIDKVKNSVDEMTNL
jgi:hypothetical protein